MAQRLVFSEQLAARIREQHAQGTSMRKLARLYAVSESTILRVIQGLGGYGKARAVGPELLANIQFPPNISELARASEERLRKMLEEQGIGIPNAGEKLD